MRKTFLTLGAVLIAASTTFAAGNPDSCKAAAHDEHMCRIGTAKCLSGGSPAECSQALWFCYTAEALMDQCNATPTAKDSKGK